MGPVSGTPGPEGPRWPRVGSAVVVIHNDRVLLGQRDKEPNRGSWVLPGGKVEPFETVAQAGTRELLEETGLLIEVGDQIGVFEIVRPPEEHRLIIYSWGRVVSGEPRAADDLRDLRFVGRDELQELNLSPVVAQVLRRVGWLEKASETAA